MNGQPHAEPSPLSKEGERFYQLLFRRPAPRQAIEAYVRACSILLPHLKSQALDPLPSSPSAIEALELATRLLNPSNPLTRRMHIMLYIAEANPGHFQDFVPQRSRRLCAWVQSGGYFLRTLGLLLRGMLLRRRYPLG